jgi:hypothetical protein
MSERVVDAFEFVDVDVEHCQLLAGCHASQFLFQLLVKQRAVRQVGQRVVMRQMRNALLGASALRDILDRGHPPARCQRLIYDQDRSAVWSLCDLMRNFPSRTLRMMAAQNSSTSPSKDPVSLRCEIKSCIVQPGLATSGDNPNISM